VKYRVEVKRSAAKALSKIPKPDQNRIIEKIDNLAENIPNRISTKMKGGQSLATPIPFIPSRQGRGNLTF